MKFIRAGLGYLGSSFKSNHPVLSLMLSIFSIIFTIIFGIYNLHSSNQTVVYANRAWLSYNSININKTVIGVTTDITGKELSGRAYYNETVQFYNTGRSPALDVVKFVSMHSLPGPGFDIPFMAGKNTTCENLINAKDRYVVPVNSPIEFRSFESTPFDPSPSPKGDWIIYIQGCVAYNTVGETHHTKFCVLLNPEPEGIPIENRKISMCGDGNEAD